MDKYLLEILKNTNTIIIPGLGALTITNSASGEIMFMPYLKFDDGSLNKYIAEKEGISENDAKNLVAKYVREVEAVINRGETYEMYEFGAFRKDKDGSVEFVNWNELKNQSKPVIPEESPVIPEKTEVPSEEKEEISPVELPEIPQTEVPEIEETPETPEHKEEETIVEPEPEETPEVPEHTEPEIIIEPEPTQTEPTENTAFKTEEQDKPETIAEILEEQTVYSEADQWNDDLDLPPLPPKQVTLEQAKKPILEKTTKDKKRKSPLLLILLIILIVGGGGGAAFYLIAKQPKDQQVAQKTPESTPEASTNDTTTEDSIPETEDSIPGTTENEEEEEETPETVPAPLTNEPVVTENTSSNIIQTSTGQVDKNRPFHIIGGAFSDKANADRYHDKLVKAGNSSVIIGRFDQLFIVSIASYATQAEADAALSNAKNTSSHAWIFRWP